MKDGPRTLRDAIATLPDEAMVPVGWVREHLGAGNDDSEDDRLSDLTLAEAAEKLKKAPSTIRAWLLAGELRGYKLHREWRITRSAIEAFLEAQRNGGAESVPRRNGQPADLEAWRAVQ